MFKNHENYEILYANIFQYLLKLRAYIIHWEAGDPDSPSTAVAGSSCPISLNGVMKELLKKKNGDKGYYFQHGQIASTGTQCSCT